LINSLALEKGENICICNCSNVGSAKYDQFERIQGSRIERRDLRNGKIHSRKFNKEVENATSCISNLCSLGSRNEVINYLKTMPPVNFHFLCDGKSKKKIEVLSLETEKAYLNEMTEPISQ